ncbi:MAG: LarC family nickel insertion protein, partial [Clostridiales bacterium]|nr:LarC family nickel insertion protein [Clostridiales bacterium]
MKILYLDCFSGISGDMTVGALLDAGADEKKLRFELKKLNLAGYELEIKRTSK